MTNEEIEARRRGEEWRRKQAEEQAKRDRELIEQARELEAAKQRERARAAEEWQATQNAVHTSKIRRIEEANRRATQAHFVDEDEALAVLRVVAENLGVPQHGSKLRKYFMYEGRKYAIEVDCRSGYSSQWPDLDLDLDNDD
jgi:hypothetical protein